MSKFLRPLLTLLAFLVLVPVVLAPVLLTAPAAMAQSSYKISPGDILQLEVIEDPSLNRSLLVLPDGSITVPSGGTIRAGGHTIPEVQSAVTQMLAPNFAKSPTVNLAVGQLAPPRTGSGTAKKATLPVYAIGEVAKPGRIDVERGTTLLQFLAESGGLTPFAATKRIQLRRTDAAGQERSYLFNYDAVMSGAQTTVITLQKGDVIIVPQRRLFE